MPSIEDVWQEVHTLRAELQQDRDALQAYIEINAVRRETNEQRLIHLEHQVFGNGKPGLLTDVDRLKQEARIAKWLTAVVIAAVLTLIVNEVWSTVLQVRESREEQAP